MKATTIKLMACFFFILSMNILLEWINSTKINWVLKIANQNHAITRIWCIKFKLSLISNSWSNDLPNVIPPPSNECKLWVNQPENEELKSPKMERFISFEIQTLRSEQLR